MIVAPRVRGFICATAHPVGCATHVQEQIDYVKDHAQITGSKRVLIIGSSTGYGLATRIVSAFGCGASTIGVSYEKEALPKRTASPGWYNTAAFEAAAQAAGLYAKSLNGDAFAHEMKQHVIDLIKADLGQIDCVIYSLASPRRFHPDSGERFDSVLKTMGGDFTNKTVNTMTGEISDVTIPPATEEEVSNTVTVMGGEDWQLWINALQEAGVLADNFLTVSYSYVGPELTYPIYREGTIGQAKKHMEQTAKILDEQLSSINGHAYVSVNKAVVTQSSAAIPVVPLYISLLFKVMKEKDLHEDCIQQIYRLYHDFLFTDNDVPLDENGLIRLDDLEMREDVQAKVSELWHQINSDNIDSLSDLDGYRANFFKLFGHHIPGVDYDQDVAIDIAIPSIPVDG